jgi:ABC-type transport system involved in multi-copper enzyme maturation permease subunit
MAMFTTWMRSSAATYFDNATSRRDYRAQLRGSRAIVLWTVYLIALIGIGMLNYASSVSRGEVSIVQAQQSLQDFYQLIMGLLGGMVILVAPALAATAIVIEKERRSLDLVFSAPVKPKSLLVGKMISAYRYTWMLLVLSLPVTAVCVVLGGATWSEVLAAYALLSLHALLYSGIALTISSLANKPVGALVWTYLAIGFYNFFAWGMAAATEFRPTGFGFGAATNEAPFTIALSPFTVVQAAGTHTTLFGIGVPNWILFGIYVLFLTRLLLLGAASSLSPFNSWETKNLRVTSTVTCGLFGFLIGYLTLSVVTVTTGGYPGAPTSSINTDLVASNILAVLPMILLIALPFIACSGTDGARKFMPNGTFSFKEAIRGTPAGALPFLLMCMAATGLGVFMAYSILLHQVPGNIFLSTLVWATGFWVFCWSFGRWASASTFELKSARTLHLASLIVLLGLPIPFLAIIDSQQQTPLWSFYPLYPLWMAGDDPSISRYAMGFALLVIGVLIAFFANRKLQSKLGAAVPA